MFRMRKHHTLTNGACLPTDYGKIDNCEQQLNERCVICNQNFKLVGGKCERHAGVPDCSIQKGDVCMQCKKGFTLRDNMCLPGDLQALAKSKRKPQVGGLERCVLVRILLKPIFDRFLIPTWGQVGAMDGHAGVVSGIGLAQGPYLMLKTF